MNAPIVTTLESGDPFAFVEFTDGRITSLQIDGRLFDRHDALSQDRNTAVRDLLAAALARHDVDVRRALAAQGQPSREERLLTEFLDEFVDARLDHTAPTVPSEVTGRATAGDVTVLASASGIGAVEIPDHLLGAERADVERALIDAANAALDEADDELVGRLDAIPLDADPPDWGELHARLKHHRRMEYR